jgi:ribosomal protein L7/L12
MNYDLLWQLRNQASADVRDKMDQLITNRYLELLEEEVLRLRQTPVNENLRMMLGVMTNSKTPRLEQIKLVRAAFNLGLVEAKEAVDNYTAELDLPF